LAHKIKQVKHPCEENTTTFNNSNSPCELSNKQLDLLEGSHMPIAKQLIELQELFNFRVWDLVYIIMVFISKPRIFAVWDSETALCSAFGTPSSS